MSLNDNTKISAPSEISEWFTLEKAAEKISIILKKKIDESEVLKLALDGDLKLSVDLPIPTAARSASIVAIADESKETIIPKDLILKAPKDAYYLKIEKGNKKLEKIQGIFDLPLKFGEYEAVRAEYSRKVNKKNIKLSHNRPLIVEQNGQFNCIQKVLRQKIDIPKSYGLGTVSMFAGTNNAIDFPKHASFVIRLEALKRYEESISLTNPSTEKPLAQNERTTLLIIIDVLLKQLKLKPDTKSLPKNIAGMTVDNETPVSEDAIRTALSKIPDALLRRVK
ncbi:hypothetical protein [Candidatus Nitrotoga sp. M5]|uniref:hypothetical protein n=1 Tax=Candidatus Nitrotoga sp. M5 TaxID=2890409 RepID=UPI001EF47BD6|nr:hypothetical protein [Candidatus Nitrotoga sp. M5]CAH1387980.1 hypothetical protein NTGM5_760010 [Candidatus Nitrotoga sp. M5]